MHISGWRCHRALDSVTSGERGLRVDVDVAHRHLERRVPKQLLDDRGRHAACGAARGERASKGVPTAALDARALAEPMQSFGL